MILMTNKNIFDLVPEVGALVNPVNTHGVAGAGLALQFRQRYPRAHIAYVAACRRGYVRIGQVFSVQDSGVHIIHFPTKDHWKHSSRLTWIEAGLQDLVEEVQQLHLRQVAVPALGCGLGGLPWARVEALYQKYFTNSRVEYLVIPPQNRA